MPDPFQIPKARKGDDPFSKRIPKGKGEFDWPGPETAWDRAWSLIKGLVVAAVCLGVVAGGLYTLWNWKAKHKSHRAQLPDVARQIVAARDAGEYAKAMELASEGLRSQSDKDAIRELSDEMLRDPRPDLKLGCWKHGVSRSVTQGPSTCNQLTPDDEFFFKLNLVNARNQCYAYLFLVDSDGKWMTLMPNKAYVPNLNPLPPASYQAPDSVQGTLKPSATPGAEKLFAVVANWRIAALEDLAAKLGAEKDPSRNRELGRQVEARLQLEQAKPDGMTGLRVGTKEFHDSGRSTSQGNENR